MISRYSTEPPFTPGPMLTRLASLSALVLLLLASPLYAQGTEPPKNVATEEAATEDAVDEKASERFRAQMAETQERLQLTDEQTETVRPILEKATMQRHAILEKHGVDLEGTEKTDRPGRRTLRRMRNDLQEVNKETQRELEEVLTSEQMKQWEALQEERRTEMRKKLSNGS